MWAQVGRAPFKGMVINRKKTGELYWAQQTITRCGRSLASDPLCLSLQDITGLRQKSRNRNSNCSLLACAATLYAARPGIGLDIGASAHPADETGGLLDFISMADGSLVIAVADAKGHGFSPRWSRSHSGLCRCFAAMQMDLDQLLGTVNQIC